MIAIVHGELLEKGAEKVLVDTGGIGYELFVPTRLLARLPAVGESVRFRTHLEVREDRWTLFGFENVREVEAFHLLTSVQGVGAKIGLGILSAYEVPQIARAIAEGNLKFFTQVSGVGKRTGNRILLELKEKVSPFLAEGLAPVDSLDPAQMATGPGVQSELEEALRGLGFQTREVEKAIDGALAKEGAEAPLPKLLKAALASMKQP